MSQNSLLFERAQTIKHKMRERFATVMARRKQLEQKFHEKVDQLEPRIYLSGDQLEDQLELIQPLPLGEELNLPLELDTDSDKLGSSPWYDGNLPAASARQLVVVDSAVSGYQSLVDKILEKGDIDSSDIVVLDGSQDGIAQITDLLGKGNYAGVHILGHGTSGELQFGNTTLNSDNLSDYEDELSQWGNDLLPGADVFLYGCHVAEGEWGVSFVNDLAEMTGVDIAASTDLTGGTDLGGDWTLEYLAGTFELDSLFEDGSADDFDGLLANDIIEAGNDNKVDQYYLMQSTINVKVDSGSLQTDKGELTSANKYDLGGKSGNDEFIIEQIPDAAMDFSRMKGGDGTDILDFSKLGSKKLEFVFDGNPKSDVNTGSSVKTLSVKVGGAVKFKNISNMETFKGNKGDNLYTFKKTWMDDGHWDRHLNIIETASSKDEGTIDVSNLDTALDMSMTNAGKIEIKRSDNVNKIIAEGIKTVTNDAGKTNLDFSGVSKDITFLIGKDGKVSVTFNTGSGDRTFDFIGVQNLKVGTGVNKVIFAKGGALAGKLQDSGASSKVEISYRKYDAPVTVNLGTTFNLKNSAMSLTPPVTTGVDYAPSEWTIANTFATAGTFTLTYRGQTTTAIDINATDAKIASELKKLSTVQNVTDTSRTSNMGKYTWKFKIVASAYQGDANDTLTMDTSGLTIPALATDLAVTAGNQVQIGANVTGGTYTLNVATAGDGENRTTVALPFDASLDMIKVALEKLENVSSATVTAAVGAGTRYDIAITTVSPIAGATVTANTTDFSVNPPVGHGISAVLGTAPTLAKYRLKTNATVGYFVLTYGGQETRALAYDAEAQEVQDALASLTSINAFHKVADLLKPDTKSLSTHQGGIVKVVKTATSDYTIEILDKDGTHQLLALKDLGNIVARSATGIAAGAEDGINGVNIISIHGASGETDRIFNKDNHALKLYGLSGNDIAVGGLGAEELQGDAGVDVFFAGGGNDKLRGGTQGDYLSGGAGRDVIRGRDGEDIIYGGAGDDKATNAADDYKERDILDGGLYGGDGDDIIYGGAGEDVIDGGNQDDVLYGGSDKDLIFGGSGKNVLYGEGGDDELTGGQHDDYLFGGADQDKLKGGSGQDVLSGGADKDELKGGKNSDTYRFEDNWGEDSVIEKAKEGTIDKLDFSRVTHDLTYEFTSSGFKVNDGGTNKVHGSTSISNVVEVERITAAAGNNSFLIKRNYRGKIRIDATQSGNVTLDLSDFQALVNTDKVVTLTFTIENDRVVVKLKEGDKNINDFEIKVVGTGKVSLVGGNGTNRFHIKDGTILGGTVTAPTTAAVKNILDYKDNARPITVNLNHTAQLAREVFMVNTNKGEAPTRDVFSLYTQAVDGSFKVKVKVEGHTERTSAAVLNLDEVRADPTLLKTALESLTHVDVVAISGKGTQQQPWIVKFNKPFSGIESLSIANDTSNAAFDDNLVATVANAEKSPAKVSQTVSHTNNAGRLKFKVTIDGTTITTADVAHDASVQDVITAFDNQNVKVAVDRSALAPTGFSWTIVFLDQSDKVGTIEVLDHNNSFDTSNSAVSSVDVNRFRVLDFNTVGGTFSLKTGANTTNVMAFNQSNLATLVQTELNTAGMNNIRVYGADGRLVVESTTGTALADITINGSVADAGLTQAIQTASILTDSNVGNRITQTIQHNAISGTFKLTFNGVESNAIEFNQSVGAVRTEIERFVKQYAGNQTASVKELSVSYGGRDNLYTIQYTSAEAHRFTVTSNQLVGRGSALIDRTTNDLKRTANGGFFTLTYNGVSTRALAHNADDNTIQTALQQDIPALVAATATSMGGAIRLANIPNIQLLKVYDDGLAIDAADSVIKVERVVTADTTDAKNVPQTSQWVPVFVSGGGKVSFTYDGVNSAQFDVGDNASTALAVENSLKQLTYPVGGGNVFYDVKVEARNNPLAPWLIKFSDVNFDFQDLGINYLDTELKPAYAEANAITGLAQGIDLTQLTNLSVKGGPQGDLFFAPTDGTAVAMDGVGGNDLVVGDSILEENDGSVSVANDGDVLFVPRLVDGRVQSEGDNDVIIIAPHTNVPKQTYVTSTGKNLVIADLGSTQLSDHTGRGLNMIIGGNQSEPDANKANAILLGGGDQLVSGGKGVDVADINGGGTKVVHLGAGTDLFRFTNDSGHVEVREADEYADIGKDLDDDFKQRFPDGAIVDTLDFTQVTNDMTFVFNEGVMVAGTNKAAGPELEWSQESLNGFTVSNGEVYINNLGFLPGFQKTGKSGSDLTFTAHHAIVNRIKNGDLTEAVTFRIIVNTDYVADALNMASSEGTPDVILELRLTKAEILDIKNLSSNSARATRLKDKLNAAAVIAINEYNNDANTLDANKLANNAVGFSTFGNRLVVTVKPKAGKIAHLRFSAPTEHFEMSVIAGKDAKNQSEIQKFEKIFLPAANTTMIFGDNWGQTEGLFASPTLNLEPDYWTAMNNATNEIKIDARDLVRAGKNLILDFRAVTQEIEFKFSKRKIEIKRKEDFFKFPTLKTPLPFAPIRFNKIIIENTDENTVLFGGRNNNSFKPDYNSDFRGTVIGGSGIRPLKDIFNPNNLLPALTTASIPTLYVENFVDYSRFLKPGDSMAERFTKSIFRNENIQIAGIGPVFGAYEGSTEDSRGGLAKFGNGFLSTASLLSPFPVYWDSAEPIRNDDGLIIDVEGALEIGNDVPNLPGLRSARAVINVFDATNSGGFDLFTGHHATIGGRNSHDYLLNLQRVSDELSYALPKSMDQYVGLEYWTGQNTFQVGKGDLLKQVMDSKPGGGLVSSVTKSDSKKTTALTGLLKGAGATLLGMLPPTWWFDTVLGDNKNMLGFFSPGVHTMAGLTGPDVYKFMGFWGLGLVLESPNFSEFLPGSIDTLDFSKVNADMHHTVFEFNADIASALGDQGIDLGIGIGTNVVISTTFDTTGLHPAAIIGLAISSILGESLLETIGQAVDTIQKESGFADFKAILDVLKLDGGAVIATGIEDIKGSKGKNFVHFRTPDAELAGRVTGKEVYIDYGQTNQNTGITADLDNGVLLPLNWADLLGDDVSDEAKGVFKLFFGGLDNTLGQAEGINGSRLVSLNDIIDQIADLASEDQEKPFELSDIPYIGPALDLIFGDSAGVVNGVGITGVKNQNDTVIGGRKDNYLIGLGGQDTFIGQDGDDMFSLEGLEVPEILFIDVEGNRQKFNTGTTFDLANGIAWYSTSTSADVSIDVITDGVANTSDEIVHLYHDGALGTFKLKYDSLSNPEVSTGDLNFNISAADLQTELQTLFGSTDVTVSGGTGDFLDPWVLTFTGALRGIDTPGEFTKDASGLKYKTAPNSPTETLTNASNISWSTTTQGDSSTNEVQQIQYTATGGKFRLSFDGEATELLTHDSSGAEVKAALELLSGIDSVSVSRSNTGNTYTFTITFDGDKVKEKNHPQMFLVNFETVGLSGVEIFAGGGGDDIFIGNPDVAETFVFGPHFGDDVVINATGSEQDAIDTDSYFKIAGGDQFAVSAQEGMVLNDGSAGSVNISFAQRQGDRNAIQLVSFDADSGYFTLSMGGEVTDPIAYNASAADVKQAIEGMANQPVSSVDVKKIQQGIYAIQLRGNLANSYVHETFAIGTDMTLNTTPNAVTTDQTGNNSQNEKQTVDLNSATRGFFTLTLGAQTTSAISHDASARDVKRALEALSNIDNVSVTENSTGNWTIEFKGDKANTDVSTLTVADASVGNLEKSSSTAAATVLKILDGGASEMRQLDVNDSTAFKIQFGAEKTAELTDSSNAGNIESALESLGGINDVEVYETSSGVFLIDFQETAYVAESMTITDSTHAGTKAAMSTYRTGGWGDIQTFSHDAESGSFVLTLPNYGATDLIAYNADAATVEAAIEDIVGVDDVSVWGSGGGFTVGFNGHLGNTTLGQISVDTDSPTLRASGVDVTASVVSTDPNSDNEKQQITLSADPDSGYFQFSFTDADGTHTSNLIAHDATADEIAAELEQLGSLDDVTVTLKSGNTVIEVEFVTVDGASQVNVNQLDVTTGYHSSLDLDTTVSQADSFNPNANEMQVITLSATPDSGYFQLEYTNQSSGTSLTSLLAHDATTDMIENALEALADIDAVNVTRASDTNQIRIEFATAESLSALNVHELNVLTTFADIDLKDTGAAAVSGSVVETNPAGGNDESQLITFTAEPTSGYFQLQYTDLASGDLHLTNILSFDASVSEIQNELQAFAEIDAVTVTRPSTTTINIEFDSVNGTSEQDVNPLQVITSFADVDLEESSNAVTAAVTSYDPGGNEVQTYHFAAAPSQGYYQIGFTDQGSQTQLSSLLGHDATASDIQTALEALDDIDDVTVTLSADGQTLTIEFDETESTPGQDVNALTFHTTFAGADLRSGSTAVTNSVVETQASDGSTMNEIQTVTFSAAPDNGLMQLTYGGDSTELIPEDASAGQIEALLEALTDLNDVTVNVTGSGFTVEFVDVGGSNYADADLLVVTTDTVGLAMNDGGAVSATQATTRDAIANGYTDELQLLTFSGDTGSFKLKDNSNNLSNAINHNDSASDIQDALKNGATNLDTVVTAVTNQAGAFLIRFVSSDATNVATLTLDAGSNSLELNSASQTPTIDDVQDGAVVNDVTRIELKGDDGQYFLKADGTLATPLFDYSDNKSTLESSLETADSDLKAATFVNGALQDGKAFEIEFAGASDSEIEAIWGTENQYVLTGTLDSQSHTITLIGDFDLSAVSKPDTFSKFSTVLTGGNVQPLMGTSTETPGAGAAEDGILTDAMLDPIMAEAFSRWSQTELYQNSGVTPDDITVRITNLPDSYLGLAQGSTLWLDADGAGFGWFMDSTPADDSEFTQDFGQAKTADNSSEAYRRFDLLTVAMHEIGHMLGLGENDTGGSDLLMNPQISTGIRKFVTSVDPSRAGDQPVEGYADGDATDQTKLGAGLATFGGWASNFGESIQTLLTSVPDIPLVGLSLTDILGTVGNTAADITSAIQTDLEDLVDQVFLDAALAGDDVTSQDIVDAAQAVIGGDTSITYFDNAATTNNREFTVSMDLGEDYSQLIDLDLDLDILDNLGVVIDSTTDLMLNASLDLDFNFGLDNNGDFFVTAPTVTANLSLDHSDPLNITLSLGDGGIGIGIVEGTAKFDIAVAFGGDGRLSFDALNADTVEGNLIGTPSLDSTASYDIYLPIVLTGPLASLQEGPGLIEAHYGGADSPDSDTSLVGFFTSLVSSLGGTNLDDILNLGDISITQVLDGAIFALDALVDEDGGGLAFQELPIINDSLVGLLGDGSANVIQKITSTLETVRDGFENMQALEVDLNFLLSDELGMNVAEDVRTARGFAENADIKQEIVDASDRLAAVFAALNGDSSDTEIALALIDLDLYTQRLNDLEIIDAAERLAAIDEDLDETSEIEDIANELADQGLLTTLKGYRQTLQDDPQFIEDSILMQQLGLTVEATDEQITEQLYTRPLDQALAAADLLVPATALDLAVKLAEDALAAFGLSGIPDDATIEGAVSAIEIETAKQYRDVLQAEADLALESLDDTATDAELSSAAGGDEDKLADLEDARRILRAAVADANAQRKGAEGFLGAMGISTDAPTTQEIEDGVFATLAIGDSDKITLAIEARDRLLTASDELITASIEFGKLGLSPEVTDEDLAVLASDVDLVNEATSLLDFLKRADSTPAEASANITALGLDPATADADTIAIAMIQLLNDPTVYDDLLEDRDTLKAFGDARVVNLSFRDDVFEIGLNLDVGVNTDAKLEDLSAFLNDIGLPPEVGLDLSGTLGLNGNLQLDFVIGVDLGSLQDGISDDEMFIRVDEFIISGGIDTSDLGAILEFGPLAGSVTGGTLVFDAGIQITLDESGDGIATLADIKAQGLSLIDISATNASLDVMLPVALAVNGQTTASTEISFSTDDLFGDISELLGQLPSLDDILSVSVQDIVDAVKKGVDYLEDFALDNQSVIADIPILNEYLDDALAYTRQGLAFVEKLEAAVTQQISHNGVSGTLDLTIAGEGGPFDFSINATDEASDVQTLLEAFFGDGNVEVTGSHTEEDPFVIRMIGDLADTDTPALTERANSMLDDQSAAATVTYPAPANVAKDLQAIENFLQGANVFDLDETQYQTISFSAVATAGVLRLQFEEEVETFLINAGDDADDIKTALLGLSSITAAEEIEVIGEGTEDNPFQITFVGSRTGENVPNLMIVENTLEDANGVGIEVTAEADRFEHLDVIFDNGAVVFDLGMDIDFNSELDFQFSLDKLAELLGDDNPFTSLLEGAANLLDVDGALKAAIELEGRLDLVFGFDASGDLGDAAFIGDESEVSIATRIVAEDLFFNAGINLAETLDLFDDIVGGNPFLESIKDILSDVGIGEIGVTVKDGKMRLDSGYDADGDGEFDAATFNFRFESDDVENESVASAGDGRYSLRELLDDTINPLVSDMQGVVEVELPMFFPNESIPMGGTEDDRNGDGRGDNILYLEITDLNDISGSMDVFVPDIKGSIGLYAILENINLATMIAGTGDSQEDGNNDGIPDNLYAGILGNLEGIMSGSLFGIDLPFIGDKLAGAANFIGEFRTGIRNKLNEISGGDATPINVIQGGLWEVLGEPGLKLIGENDGVAGITIDDIVITGDARHVQFDFRIADVVFDETVDLDFAAAIPGLGLEFSDDAGINLKVDYAFDFAFGISIDDGFYIDTSDVGELELNIDASLSENFESEVTLGFLNLEVKDNGIKDLQGNDRTSGVFGKFYVDIVDQGSGGGNANDRLTLGELFSGVGDAFEVGFAGKAEANLFASLGIDGVDQLPNISTDFVYSQQFGLGAGAPADPFSGSKSFGSAPIIEFRDVTLELSGFLAGFLKPVFGEIQKITKPLDPIIDILTAPVPIVSTLEGKDTTFLDFAARFGGKAAGFFKALDAVVSILKVVNDIKTDGSEELLINFGTFKIGGPGTSFDLRQDDTKTVGCRQSGARWAVPPRSTMNQA